MYKAEMWMQDVEDWQKNVREDVDVFRQQQQQQQSSSSNHEPSFYAHQLFNELYYLSDGGSLWLDSTDGQENASDSMATGLGGMLGRLHEGGKAAASDLLPRLSDAMGTHSRNVSAAASAGDQSLVGQWLYFEGHEYLMFNTSDVHFYAGAALRSLWPQLELSIQKDYARAVDKSDSEMRAMLSCGTMAQRKVRGTVPHDMGSPSDMPFTQLNAYNFQDVSQWRDLGSKFALQVYAAYLSVSSDKDACAPKQFLREVFPAVLTVMQGAMEFLTQSHDSLIHNGPFPDQTYDIWPCKGASAYCGGLWVAATQATAAMANILDHGTEHERFFGIAQRAQAQYTSTLWNGTYINFDTSSDAVQSDMLAGHAWSLHLGLPGVVTSAQALSCYNIIYNLNVIGFAKIAAKCRGEGAQHGTSSTSSGWSVAGPVLWGAVNGMKPNGCIDESCIQSRECWPGTTYALSAAMLVESTNLPNDLHENAQGIQDIQAKRSNLVSMAFATAQGVHDAGWRRLGFHWATPEAWDCRGDYRAIGYMRPLSIWQMQAVIMKVVHAARAGGGAGINKEMEEVEVAKQAAGFEAARAPGKAAQMVEDTEVDMQMGEV